MIFISITVFGQDWLFRPDSSYYIPHETKGINCSSTSLAYTNRYKIISNYIPSSSHPTKTIKVNFNIIQQDDSTGNFYNTQDDTNTLNAIFTSFRNRYITLSAPSDPIAGVTSLSFTKFDFELSNIYFYQNTTLYSSSSISALNNYVKNLYPERMNELNIYFTCSSNKTNATMPGEFYSNYNLGIAMCGKWYEYDPNVQVWATGGGICHEMGHCLNLGHTYPGGGTSCSLAGMVAQESWFADLFGEPFPGNAFHLSSNYSISCGTSCPDCPPITIEGNADPYDNSYQYSDRVTNNFMGNQWNHRKYLSPSQIGKAHRAAYFSALRRYVKDNCYDENNPIIIDNNETWDFNIRVYQDIIIENNAQCEITCHVELPYNAKIIVRNGSTLVVDGSITGVNGEAWRGQIDIEPGGELIIEDDGQIFLGEGGSIVIDKSSTDIATLIYNFGAEIVLSHNTSNLEIVGNLHIAPNAQFTFSGNGYVKFSNPGADTTTNITAGAGASMLFKGSGKNHKVLEVQQNTVRFPLLDSLVFRDCKIEMGENKRMLATANYPITFDNILLTSTTGNNNAHRSFHLYGQSNTTVKNSIFEYGLNGLYAKLIYYGAKLNIANSEFRHNTRGLYVYGKGVNANFCKFNQNEEDGAFCEAASSNSDFTNCSFLNNNKGLVYHSSAANLNVSVSNIKSNTETGIETSGAFTLNIACNNINNNYIGIKANNSTSIYADNDAQNNISQNTRTIYLNPGKAFICNGYNQLQAKNNSYTLSGYSFLGPTPLCGRNIATLASHNRWESNVSAQPSSTNHLLYVYGCYDGTKEILKDFTPDYHVCYHPIPQLPMPLGQPENEHDSQEQNDIFETNNSNFNQFSLNSENDFNTTITTYASIVENLSKNLSTEEVIANFDKAYFNIHSILLEYYQFVDNDRTHEGFNEALDLLIELNENILSANNLSYAQKLIYKLSIPLLNRLRGEYDASISELENLILEITDNYYIREKAFAEKWLCFIEAEQQLEEGIMSIDEFDLAIEDCNYFYSQLIDDNLLVSESESVEQNDCLTINVLPNPNQGTFSISLNQLDRQGEIRITKTGGQLVYLKQYSNEALTISGFSKGEYTIYYVENQEIKASANFVVE
ncbi:MAG: hypothetical protein GX879_00180 [Bacteroidales bacterium]|nr:hypothetical protein [Bacteroidales bacterium]